SEKNVLKIARDVTSGLRAAYQQDLIHRDIKPGNMLVTENGTAKLVDFGLAVQQGGKDETEDIWATPFYVPPEKLVGEPDTYRGDIYSLGATLYHALAGKPPFEANTSSLEELKVIKAQPLDLKSDAPSVKKPIQQLVDRMMAYEPKARFESYDEIIEEIDTIRRKRGDRVTSNKPNLFAALPTPARFGIIGAAVLATIGLTLLLIDPGGDDSDDPGLAGLRDSERVVSASDEAKTQAYIEGRKGFVEGEWIQAIKLLSPLAEDSGVPQSTRRWSRFFVGVSELMKGDWQASVSWFNLVAFEDFDNASELPPLEQQLVAAAQELRKPLPVMGEPQEAFGALGLFAAGVKNWQHGEFDSGLVWLEAFNDSSIPDQLDFLERLKTLTKDFRADAERLSSLPNPRFSDGVEDWSQVTRSLEAGKLLLNSEGSGPRLIERRLARIETLQQGAASFDALPDPRQIVEEARALAKARPVPVDPPDGPTRPTQDPASLEIPGLPDLGSPDWETDLARIRELLSAFEPLKNTWQFANAINELSSEVFASQSGTQIGEDLVATYEAAARFPAAFVTLMSDSGYYGVVRRKGMKPLEMEITEAIDGVLQVDLGFGNNSLEVAELENLWLIETAIGRLREPTTETAAEWEMLVSCALA
ncbi:MAG: serine/threonine-protein kinase, partial [Verrucomicrobiota bacterium]